MSSARDLLAPLILPPRLGAAGDHQAAQHLLDAGGPDFDRFGTWIAVLGLYDSVFVLVGYATFDYLLED